MTIHLNFSVKMNSRSYDVSHCIDDCPSKDDQDVGTPINGKSLSNLPWKTKLFFSFGHIYNDLCASIWFSYTLIFFQMQFRGTIAGILLLLGQVADAVATPFVGYESKYFVLFFLILNFENLFD